MAIEQFAIISSNGCNCARNQLFEASFFDLAVFGQSVKSIKLIQEPLCIMNNLFSQIPFAVLDKAGCVSRLGDEKPGPKSKKKRKYYEEFYDEDEVRPKESVKNDEEKEEKKNKVKDLRFDLPPLDEEDFQDDSLTEQITSSFQEPIKKGIECFPAITQTSPKKTVTRGVQTEEWMLARPLSSTDNDIHRMNMQTYAPITPIPRADNGSNPPLRIGLTLRGKKRMVYYPDLENSEN